MNNFIEKTLYYLSLLISGLFLFGYLLYKLFAINFFEKISVSIDNGTFIVIFASFLILCNLPNLIGIIKSIVRDKVSEQTILELIPTIKDKLKEDKNLIKELIDKYNKDKSEESKIKEGDINK